MIKRLFFFAILLSLAGISRAYDFSAVCGTGQTLYYNISGSNVIVTSQYSDYPYYSTYHPIGSLEIPSSVTYNGTTYTVTSIGNYAFFGCSGLTSVTIGDSVTSIGTAAFRNCTGLTTLNYNADSCGGDGFTTSSDRWLHDCTALATVNIGNNVRVIPDKAFYRCIGLTSITIPNSVTTIGVSAFWGCGGLTSVTIGNSVTSIGWEAFGSCTSLTTLNYNADSCGGNGFTTTSHWLYGCTALATVNIGNNVRVIPTCAFLNRNGLTTITIPNSVTSIGDNAFWGCGGLTSVTIPNSVTSIGNGAFADCIGLTSVTIPNSVTSIGNSVFNYCIGLTSVTIGNSVTSIGDYAFWGCTGLTSVTIPNSVTSIGKSAFYNCTGLTSVTIGDSVTSIGDGAFWGCSGLTSVTIPNSVTSIGEEAFYNCTGLTNVIMLPTTPPILAEEVFYNTPSSLTIIIPCGTMADYQTAWGNGYNFVESCAILYTVTATANDATMGMVSGGGTYEEGSEATLEATANDGYRFDRWDDGNTDNPRTITVTGDATFIAYFVSTQGIGDVTADGVTLIARDGRITISGADGRQVTLTDALGRVHYRGTATEPLTIGVPTAGIYLLQVDSLPAKRIAVVK